MNETEYVAAVQKYVNRFLRMDADNRSTVNVSTRRCPMYSVQADRTTKKGGNDDGTMHYVLMGKSFTPDLDYALNKRKSRQRPRSVTVNLPVKTKRVRNHVFWLRPGTVQESTQQLKPTSVAIGCTCGDYEYNGQEAKTRDRANLLGCKHMMLVNKRHGNVPIVPTPAPPYAHIVDKLRFELEDDDDDF